MKIAVISMIRDAWGGSEELWYEMALEALKQKHAVYHLSYEVPQQHAKTRQLIELGMHEYARPSYRPAAGSVVKRLTHRVGFMFRKRFDDSLNKIFQQQPDLVVYNGTSFSIGDEKKLLRLIRTSKCRFAIIVQLEDDRIELQMPAFRNRVKDAYQRAESVALLSARTKKVIEAKLDMTLDNAAVVRNPVNMKNTDPIPYPVSNTIQFAMVGNLVTRHKGQDTVISILSGDRWKAQDFHLNIYGKGPDEKDLKDMVAKAELQHKVSFHGHVSDIRKVWEQNQVLLMPSHMEGVALAMVEAMLCGRLIVATDVGGHGDWIDDGVNGFLAEDSSVAAFDAALNRAYAQKHSWPAIAMRAHEKAKKMYDPHTGKTLLNLLAS